MAGFFIGRHPENFDRHSREGAWLSFPRKCLAVIPAKVPGRHSRESAWPSFPRKRESIGS
jgi:hypothetical protein